MTKTSIEYSVVSNQQGKSARIVITQMKDRSDMRGEMYTETDSLTITSREDLQEFIKEVKAAEDLFVLNGIL